MDTELTKEQIAELQAENKQLKTDNGKLTSANAKLLESETKLKGDVSTLKNENGTLKTANTALTSENAGLKSQLETAEQINVELQAHADAASAGKDPSLTFEHDGQQFRAVHAVYISGDREYSALEIAENVELRTKLIEQQSSAVEAVAEVTE